MNSNFQLPTDDMYNQGQPRQQSLTNALDDSLKNPSIAGRTDRSAGMVEPSELELELFNRLLKTGVIRASPAIKTIHERKIVLLDQQNSQRFLTGLIFAHYLIVLKEVMYKLNQDFAIDENLPSLLKEQVTPQARLYNWNFLCTELDKIGIIIENDIKSLYVAGDSEEIGRLFVRIEKYIKRISGDADVLSFKDYRRDDRKRGDLGGTGKQNLSGLDGHGQGRRGLQTTQKRPIKDGVDIMSMDVNRDPGDTESTLEFILNTLCRALTMKPKQAAALLTNNNQFLTHCVVKGVKSRFEPMVNWYNDIYQNSRHLSMMLETEVENSVASKDPKMIKAAQQNFEKVLQTISTGCYSQNFDVAQLCMKTLNCIAQDFNGSIEMVQLSMKWFLSKDNGLYTANYAYKKHPDLTEEFVSCIGNFTNGGEQMNAIYINELNNLYPDMVDYFNCVNQMFPFIQMNYQSDLVQAHQRQDDYLLAQLIEKASRFAESTMQNTPQVRISAISLLTEMWLAQAGFIDKQNTHKNQLESIYQRSSRDRMRSVRTVTITQIFKLLDKFSAEKIQSAPTLYKQLIFSLVESPQDQTIRELYLTNFQYLYENMKSIPVGLLIEPFVKANQASDAFVFQTFDYDFFAFMAQHPKLTEAHAIQMLDLLARQYLNDVCNASAVSVPFIMICSRFLSALQCQEFIMKFITISLSQLLQISSSKQDLLDNTKSAGSQKGKPLALPAPPGGSDSRLRNNRGSSMRGGPGNKDFRISTGKKTSNKAQIANQVQKADDDINNKLKKSQIITMLLKIQNLRQDDVNNAMRDMLLGAQKQYKDQNYGYVNNGIMAVLKYWGDPDLLFNQYLKRQEKIEAEERKAYERLQRQEQVERRMLGYESDEKNRDRGSLSVGKSKKGLGVKGVSGTNSMALMPIAENQQNLRALHELEMIKKYKKDKEIEEKRKLDGQLKLQTKKDARLREELERRKVEVGVPANQSGVRQELKALIYKSDEVVDPKRKNRSLISTQMQLIDLNEEEDRDREIINQFMKKYLKIWKYLFSRYSNQMYSSKGKKDFDDLGLRQQQINLPEAIKMLKDHDTFPQLISKNEMQQMFRLINMHTKGTDESSIAMLDYNQFLIFVPQLALFCFSRPPVDKSQFPPIQSLLALIDRFEQATRDRGKSTVIYEDPDATPFADRELLQALDKKVNEDPSYPIPEGFRKVQGKVPVYRYEVPDTVRMFASEEQIIATELMDEIVFKALGVHFLEPLVHFEVSYKVKPAISKIKKAPAEALGYMKKVERKVDEDKQKGTAFAQMSAAEKRRLELEIVPKINLALKLQVTKHDLASRPHYQEVAEVLEEMLQAVEKGYTHLPPRPHRRPGQLVNEAKAQRELEEHMAAEQAMQQEMKRQERDTRLKKKLKDSNFGGRQMPLEDYKKIKHRVEQEEQEKLERKDREKFQARQRMEREKVAQMKAKQLQDLQEQKAEQARQEDSRRKAEEQVRKDFLSKQKQKIQDGFQETYKNRDTVILRKDEQKKFQKDHESKLKKQMNKYIQTTKQEREIEKLERKEVQEFLELKDVAAVFDTYQRQLFHMFKFYAAQDSHKDKLAYDSEWLMSTLSYKELVRWSYQQDITPNLVTPEDMVYIYKTLVREQEDILQERAEAENRVKSGMIDYTMFKKAICRISIRSQEKLGGGNQDLLEAKLNEDTRVRDDKMRQRDRIMTLKSKKEAQEKEKMDQLRQQFQQEQEYKESQLSKQAKDQRFTQAKETNEHNATLTRQQKQELKQYQLDQAKLQQEEEFFAKWLKQRENLGVTADSAALQSSRTAKAADLRMLQKKDLTQKELEQLDAQLKEQQRLKSLKVEKGAVREKMDVNMISASTVEAFMRYLGLDLDTNERELQRRLTEANAHGKRTTVVRPGATPASTQGKKVDLGEGR